MKKLRLLLGYDALLFVMSVIGLLVLALLKTSGLVRNENYLFVYVILAVVTVVLSGFSVLFSTARKSAVIDASDDAVFLDDSSSFRPGAFPPVRYGAMVLLAILVFMGVSETGANFGQPNPYGADLLSSSEVQEHGFLSNLLLISIFPGFYEEMIIFFFVSAIVMLIRWGYAGLTQNRRNKDNPVVFLVAVLIAVTAGAALFTFAHNEAYGLNQDAKVSAFVFEWTAQLANQLVGAPVSWLAHMVHNAFIVFDNSFAIAVGGVGAFLFARKRWFA